METGGKAPPREEICAVIRLLPGNVRALDVELRLAGFRRDEKDRNDVNNCRRRE
jgi:hypothetical protein